MATISAPTSPSNSGLAQDPCSGAAAGSNGMQGAQSTSRRRTKKERLAALLTGGGRASNNVTGRHAGNLPVHGGRYHEADASVATKKSTLPRFSRTRSNTDSQLHVQHWTDPDAPTGSAASSPASTKHSSSGNDVDTSGKAASKQGESSPNMTAGTDNTGDHSRHFTLSSGGSKPKLNLRLRLRRRPSKSKGSSHKDRNSLGALPTQDSPVTSPAADGSDDVAGVGVIANSSRLSSGHSTPDLHQPRQYLSDISLNSNESKTSAVKEHARMRLLAEKQPSLPIEGGTSPTKGFKALAASRIRRSLRFRRNSASGRLGSSSSAQSAKAASSPQSVTAPDSFAKGVALIPGSFRRLSGIRDQKIVDNGGATAQHADCGTSSAPGSRSNSGTAFERVVDIRRENAKPFGFKFIFELPRKASSTSDETVCAGGNWDQEPSAYVTQVERNSIIETQHLLEVGDRIMTINGVAVASARRAQDLREMVQTADQLVMTVRSSYDAVPAASTYTMPKSRSRSDPRNPVEYEYTPQPRPRPCMGYSPGELATKGMSGGLMTRLSAAVAKRPQADSPGNSASPQNLASPLPPGNLPVSPDLQNTKSASPYKCNSIAEVGSEAETTPTTPQVQDVPPGPLANADKPSPAERPQLVACMDAILEDTSLTADAKQEAIAKQLGTQLDLPFLSEPASCISFSEIDLDEDDNTPSELVRVRNISDKMAQSVLSLLSSDDDGEIFAEVTGDSILSEQAIAGNSSIEARRSKPVMPVDGFMLVRLLDGSGFASKDSSHLYCVLDIGGKNTAARSSALQATGSNTVLWDEDFDVNLEFSRQLVISVYAIAPGKDVLRAQTALYLEPLFRSARLRRLRLALPSGGILRLKLAYADRTALLRRLPSASQYGTFGISLSQVVLKERVTVPLIIQKCIFEIDRRGLRHVGLYRVNGSSKKKRALRTSFETNSRTAMLSEEHVPDVNVIVGLLKEYLRELPEPLLTHALYSRLIEAVKPSKDREGPEEEVRRQRLYDVLAQLPQAEMDTCRMLFAHFARVLENSAHNQMTAHNLAICLGPVLMMPSPQSPKKVPHQVAQDHNAQIGVIFHILVFGWPESLGHSEGRW